MMATAIFGGNKFLRFVAAGIAFGTAGFCAAEMIQLTSDVTLIPDLFDRVWLGFNAIVSFIIGYLNLKRY